MARKSHGFRIKTRGKLTKDVRTRGKVPVSRILQVFNVGDSVHVILEPSVHKGMPFPRFHGKTGKVVGKRGSAYLLSVMDGNKEKTVISRPEHMKKQVF